VFPILPCAVYQTNRQMERDNLPSTVDYLQESVVSVMIERRWFGWVGGLSTGSLSLSHAKTKDDKVSNLQQTVGSNHKTKTIR